MSAEAGFDVVVVGSGAGGGSTAWALARSGVRVLVLEAGPSYDYSSDYRLDSAEWEQHGFPDRMRGRRDYTIAPLQELEARRSDLRSWDRLSGPYNPGERRWGYEYAHVKGVGGSTLHYSGEAHRMHPEAMRMRTRFGVAADWPLAYAELEPYYVEAEMLIGAAGSSFDPVRWRSRPYPLPPHPLSYASQKVAEGCRSLGLSLVPNALGILSEPYDGRPPCNYCANCVRGCPRADKASVDVTFLAQARTTGRCTIRPECQVVHLEAAADDRVARVHYVDPDGGGRAISARAVVVACGAVQTPRLLLASESRHAPAGLGNESGQVGRHFMETIFWAGSGLHPEPLGSHRGLPADAICWDFNAPDAIPGGVVGGCRFSVGAGQIGLVGPIAYATRLVPGWGRAHKARMREVFGRAVAVGGIAECLPNPRAYVDLDPEAKDEHGVPLARIHSHLEEGEVRRLAFMAESVRAILRASGVEDVAVEFGSYDIFASTHVFGTCRMGHDPEGSVLDSTGRSHRWRNLYVSDASVFPSSGGGEAPSLTIEALGIRTASFIRESLRRGEL
jgi:choline dehydrogenase-like flavoprotein